jgi:acyl carrier protein
MTTLEKLEKFMLGEVAVELGRESLKPDEDLLEQGIIDSLGIMKLIVFLEETFGIKVNDEDVVPENFQSLDIMLKFIEEKMRNK